MRADPTDETRGFTRMPPSTRNLLRKNDTTTAPFFRGATAKRCKALTPCVVTLADGTQYEMRVRKDSVELTPPKFGATVDIRRRTLKRTISETLLLAEYHGMNLDNVANSYRTRRDNGYQLETSIETNETYSFRGQEV